MQQALLKMLEGAEVSVSTGEGITKSKTTMNTSNILFIVGGAFVGIDESISKRIQMKNALIGFNNKLENLDEEDLKELTHRDLIEYGMIPEFVGRIPVLATLDDLSEADMKNILTKPKNAIIKQYRALFKVDGIDLTFNKTAIDYIVCEAMKKKIGARGLKSVIEKKMFEIMYEVPQTDIKKFEITREILADADKKNKKKASM